MRFSADNIKNISMTIDVFFYLSYNMNMVNKCFQKGSLSKKNIKELKKNIEVLNDENRLCILCLLKKHKELCVCEIYKALDLPQNLVSYHLGKLKEAGFLESTKQGVKVIYRQGDSRIKTFKKLIELLKE